MKQVFDLNSLWFNTKRTLYAAMVIVVAISIPLLSYMELSHTEPKKEEVKTEVANTATSTKQLSVVF